MQIRYRVDLENPGSDGESGRQLIGLSGSENPVSQADAGTTEEWANENEFSFCFLECAGETTTRDSLKSAMQEYFSFCKKTGSFGDDDGKVRELAESCLKRIHEMLTQLNEVEEGDAVHELGICFVAVAGDRLVYIHSGSSRIYRLADGGGQLLTDDQTEAWELVESGKVSPSRVHTYPGHKILTHVLGGAKGRKPVLKAESIKLEEGDGFLVASSEMTSVIGDPEIQELLSSNTVDRIIDLDGFSSELREKLSSEKVQSAFSVISFVAPVSKWSQLIATL